MKENGGKWRKMEENGENGGKLKKIEKNWRNLRELIRYRQTVLII